MELSRITRGKIELRTEPIELAAVIRSAVEASRPLIEASGHQLAISIPPEPLILHGDPVRLAQVFSNLLNNSAKYMNDGGQIWLSAKQQGSGGCLGSRHRHWHSGRDASPHFQDVHSSRPRQLVRPKADWGLGSHWFEHWSRCMAAKSKPPAQGPAKAASSWFDFP